MSGEDLVIAMSNKKWRLVGFILLVCTLLLAACGDETAPDEQPGTLPATRLNLADCSQQAANLTPKSGAALPATVANSSVKVDLQPGTKLFISNTFPYALALPDGWDVRENQTQGNIKADLFVIKKPTTSVAGFTVISEKLTDNTSSQSFFDAKMKEFTAYQKVEYEQQAQKTIGGVPAFVISYNSPAGQPFAYPVQIIQLIFTAQNRGWVATFTASPKQAVQYCPLFARTLESWQFTGLIK